MNNNACAVFYDAFGLGTIARIAGMEVRVYPETLRNDNFKIVQTIPGESLMPFLPNNQ